MKKNYFILPPEDIEPPPGPPRLFRAFFFCNAAANTVVPNEKNK